MAAALNRCSQSALASRVFGCVTSSSTPYRKKYPLSFKLRATDHKDPKAIPHTLTSYSYTVQPALSVFQRTIITPILNLLRIGATPRRLAWSLAIGFAIGINPLLGSTTVLCFALAFLFRLNLVASQIANHLAYPLQLALFFLFIRAGNAAFHTASLPLTKDALLAGVRHHPWDTTRLLWTWEWHALIVWLIAAAILTPLLAAILTPALNRLLLSLQNQPIVEK